MEITLNELYEGHAALIKNKQFGSSKSYVEPFIDQMSKYTNDFKVSVKLADTMSTGNDKTNIIYPRVLVEAVMPEEHSVERHDETIGLLYGLDVRKPIVSMYRGYLNQACTNLTVFNPEWIRTYELEPETPIDYSPIKGLMESTSNFKTSLDTIKGINLERVNKELHLGQWIDNALKLDLDTGFGKVKISPAHVIKAYKQLFLDQSSEYFIPEGHNDVNMFDVYNSFTQVVTDDKKDIMQKFNKTRLISDVLELPFNKN